MHEFVANIRIGNQMIEATEPYIESAANIRIGNQMIEATVLEAR
jgi:hypothetical protein